jgi:hypothetical protein
MEEMPLSGLYFSGVFDVPEEEAALGKLVT